jgi:DNA-binding CsgD family transcriptional regulator
MLQAFGVGQAAETVYRAMLTHNHTATATLATSLGWTEDAVAAACAELVRLCLARPSWDDPTLLRPVPPELGLERLMAGRRAELLRQQHELEQGRVAIELLAGEVAARHGGSGPHVEELRGADAVREGFERLAIETRSQLWTFAPVRVWTAEAMSASRPLHRRLLDQGVSLRFVYLASIRNDQAATGHLRWLLDAGVHVRTAPLLPLPLVVSDRRSAVVPLVPDRPEAGACILRGAGAVAAMCALFEHEWRVSTPLGQRTSHDGTPLTADEGALLRLLVQGHTDEQVARRMAVSVRTVGRMTSALMARLGARSRFQAGALAADEGWLGDIGVGYPGTTGSAVTAA